MRRSVGGPALRAFLALLPGLATASLPAAAQTNAAVSFSRQIAPLFQRSCNGCHHPGKEKGGLDLASYGGLVRGGKHGSVLGGDASGGGRLLENVRGPKPEMPKDGDALSAEEVGLLERWVREGAHDDTPPTSDAPPAPPVYQAAPIVTAMAVSPDGRWLAIGGFHEVLLFDGASFAPAGRLPGQATRIESLKFSPDSARLAAAGGTPGKFGEIQVWAPATAKLLLSRRVGPDSLFGVDWSPAADRLCFGGADKTARVIRAEDGKELMRFDQQTDWVFAAAFLHDGRRLVAASRDKSVKLIDAASGALLDVVNRDSEPIRCAAFHPREDWVVIGTEVRPRMYKARPKPDNFDPNQDPNFVREFDHFDNGITALAFSPDGKWLLSAGSPAGEARVHDVSNGQRKATLRGHQGVIFAAAFSADGARAITAGYEGTVRVFDWAQERIATNFIPVTIAPAGRLANNRP